VLSCGSPLSPGFDHAHEDNHWTDGNPLQWRKQLMSRARQPIRIVLKGWGREVWIANGDLYCGKILEIQKGRKCSLHYHKIKTESFYLRSGRLKVRVLTSGDSPIVEEFELEAGQCMDVPVGLIHQIEAIDDAEIYEFSTQHFDHDSHRLIPGD
jgi:mannose-6-phosphate isomerase